MNKKMLALYGLKWNPFAPDVPVEALHVSRRIETFCWRIEQLVGEGGFALVTGVPGAGKSVTLRIPAGRLGNQRDARIGIVTRPQAGLADFYREMGDLFGVELAPHNRWAGAKVLRSPSCSPATAVSWRGFAPRSCFPSAAACACVSHWSAPRPTSCKSCCSTPCRRPVPSS